jgi:hypothetical protein
VGSHSEEKLNYVYKYGAVENSFLPWKFLGIFQGKFFLRRLVDKETKKNKLLHLRPNTLNLVNRDSLIN